MTDPSNLQGNLSLIKKLNEEDRVIKERQRQKMFTPQNEVETLSPQEKIIQERLLQQDNHRQDNPQQVRHHKHQQVLLHHQQEHQESFS